jgi:hypothetical protein
MEERQKTRISGLLATIIHRGFTVLIDSTLLCHLGIANGHVRGALNRIMSLKHLTVILLLFTGMRRMVTWRLGITPHKRLAGSALLGRPDGILPLLTPFLVARVHPEITEKRDND